MGEIHPIPGHEITRETVQKADAVVVRSITRVDETLLSGTRISFVGTATAGIDHLDTAFLSDSGIVWANAPGANAESVVEYVLAAMSVIASRVMMSLAGKTLGVIGCGQTGERLARRAERIGMRVLRNDPPRAEREGDEGFHSLRHVLAHSDMVSVHVPLTTSGPYTTRHLVDAAGIALMRPGAWLIQTSRGGTVEESAAMSARRNGQLGALILDVFEGEPGPRMESISIADIATGHIAGYSRDAKRNGALMIRDALCRHLGIEPRTTSAVEIEVSALRPPVDSYGLPSGADDPAWMDGLLRQIVDIRGDDQRFRTVMQENDGRGHAFHSYRATYPARYSWSRYQAPWSTKSEQHLLEALGFCARS